MTQNIFKRGFTLIELLVVIAIIGILASVVLASLGTARERGAVAAYQAEVQQSVPDTLLYCEANPAGTFSYTGGSQTGASSINCVDFMAGSSTAITRAAGATHSCIASTSINGASFSSDC